jgi:hypothetical protein
LAAFLGRSPEMSLPQTRHPPCNSHPTFYLLNSSHVQQSLDSCAMSTHTPAPGFHHPFILYSLITGPSLHSSIPPFSSNPPSLHLTFDAIQSQ